MDADARRVVVMAAVALVAVATAAAGSAALAQDLTGFTEALELAESEIRTGIMPAVVGILGTLVVVGLAVAIGGIVSRGR